MSRIGAVALAALVVFAAAFGGGFATVAVFSDEHVVEGNFSTTPELTELPGDDEETVAMVGVDDGFTGDSTPGNETAPNIEQAPTNESVSDDEQPPTNGSDPDSQASDEATPATESPESSGESDAEDGELVDGDDGGAGDEDDPDAESESVAPGDEAESDGGGGEPEDAFAGDSHPDHDEVQGDGEAP